MLRTLLNHGLGNQETKAPLGPKRSGHWPKRSRGTMNFLAGVPPGNRPFSFVEPPKSGDCKIKATRKMNIFLIWGNPLTSIPPKVFEFPKRWNLARPEPTCGRALVFFSEAHWGKGSLYPEALRARMLHSETLTDPSFPGKKVSVRIFLGPPKWWRCFWCPVFQRPETGTLQHTRRARGRRPPISRTRGRRTPPPGIFGRLESGQVRTFPSKSSVLPTKFSSTPPAMSRMTWRAAISTR